MAHTRIPMPRDTIAAATRDTGAEPQPERLALIERIQAAAEREIAAVERIVEMLDGTDPKETEGAARTLASLARTLRDLKHLDASAKDPEPPHEEPIPRDIDELRRSLARKLEAFIASGSAGVPEPS